MKTKGRHGGNKASVDGKVHISAAKELVLECGGGFIQLKDGSVTIGAPLDLFYKVITIQKQGKAQMRTPMPALPHPVPAISELEFRYVYPDGAPIGGCRYVARLDDGTSREGYLDAEGFHRVRAGTGQNIERGHPEDREQAL